MFRFQFCMTKYLYVLGGNAFVPCATDRIRRADNLALTKAAAEPLAPLSKRAAGIFLPVLRLLEPLRRRPRPRRYPRECDSSQEWQRGAPCCLLRRAESRRGGGASARLGEPRKPSLSRFRTKFARRRVCESVGPSAKGTPTLLLGLLRVRPERGEGLRLAEGEGRAQPKAKGGGG